MKIKILSQGEGFKVLFLDADLVTVANIKLFSTALLSGMGYRLETTKVKKRDSFFFFNVVSVDERKLDGKDLFYSLDKATRGYMKEEKSYS